MALTKRQYQVLAFLDSFVRRNGYCPSYDEVRKSLGLSSLATVHKHMNTLEGKGFIRRGGNRSRSIEVIDRRPMIEATALRTEASTGFRPLRTQPNLFPCWVELRPVAPLRPLPVTRPCLCRSSSAIRTSTSCRSRETP